MTITTTTTAVLVKESLEKTNAHGLARVVKEKQLYVRILWLLAWLVCCCVFLKQFVGFATKLRLNEVTSSFQSDAVPFEYPDLYFCYDSPISGTQPLILRENETAAINESFRQTMEAFSRWKAELLPSELDSLASASDEASVKMNSLPYRFLADAMGHSDAQSILNAAMIKSNGLTYSIQQLTVAHFYHPSHLRCFNVSLNATQKEEMLSVGPDDTLDFLVMLDAPDSRIGRPTLPVLSTPNGNMTAEYWALDKDTLSDTARWSAVRVYITQPAHYPSEFSTYLLLEAGRNYIAKLKMTEQVHNEDPSSCIDEHPEVQLVNPYDNSPYTVAYDYAYCYNSAVQAQLQRELNATLGYLPHPWPPGNRLLYNLSSGWGSLQDVRQYLAKKDGLRSKEPQERCASAHRCTERIYTASVNSVLWPSSDSFNNFMTVIAGFYPYDPSDAPALNYLRDITTSVPGRNSSEQISASDYVRANFLKLQLTAAKPKADRTVYARGYSFESFVADIGGILGIYLGMSVLTACELMQFLHDLFLMTVVASRGKLAGSGGGGGGGGCEKAKEQQSTGMVGVSSAEEFRIYQQCVSRTLS